MKLSSALKSSGVLPCVDSSQPPHKTFSEAYFWQILLACGFVFSIDISHEWRKCREMRQEWFLTKEKILFKITFRPIINKRKYCNLFIFPVQPATKWPTDRADPGVGDLRSTEMRPKLTFIYTGKTNSTHYLKHSIVTMKLGGGSIMMGKLFFSLGHRSCPDDERG